MRTYKIKFSPKKFHGELTWVGTAAHKEAAISNLIKAWFHNCHRRGLNIKNAEIEEIHEEYVSWHPSMIYKD